jgi:putative ABC transport system permease protein
MGNFLQDLRIGWRGLARTPAFTFVVVVVMALGIGANTMIFNIVNAFLFHPFPYVDDKQNVRIWVDDKREGTSFDALSMADFLDLRDRSKSFASMVAWSETQAYITLGREPERFDATWLTTGAFKTFNAPLVLGRDFLPQEEHKGPAYTVIILSDHIWKERFGADPKVLGRTLRMNGRVRQIIGVAPPEFRLPETAEFFVPYPYDPAEDHRGNRFVNVAALLKPGVTLTQAHAEVAKIGENLKKEYPDDHSKALTFRATDYRANVISEEGPILAILMSAVGFVLLIACANVANLLLARGAGRQREIALRFALGATRGRIVRQLLTESLILAVLGGGLGLLLALWGRDLVLSSIPVDLPYWMKFETDLNTILFLIGSSLIAAVLAGMMPALQTSQVDVHEALKEGGTHGASSKRRNRMRSALVVAEISLALILLTGAGLMIKSFLKMSAQRTAIVADNVLTGRFTMPVAVYADDAAKLAFTDALMPAIASLPGVQAASAIQALPLGRNSWQTGVWLDGDPIGKDAPVRIMYQSIVRPDYFKVMGIPIRKGRDFNTHDTHDGPRVAIVSESAARKMWPGKEPIGQRFKWAHEDTAGYMTVVGVVADVRQHIQLKKDPETIYCPHSQSVVQTLFLVVKHTGPPGALATAIRRTIQSRDADMPFYDVRTMNEWLKYSLWEDRIYASLMSVFAVLALTIAAIGIYGVMAYTVAQRTQEIGIRMALGAARSDVMRMVVVQAARLTLLGIGIGLAGAFAVTRGLASQLFGVSPYDPPTFVGVTVILAFSALIAAWVPADRATRVDPMVALRSE